MLETAFAELVEGAVAKRVAPIEAAILALMRVLDERLPAPWLTRRVAAEQLEVDVSTVDRRIAAGDPSIEVHRVGRAVRVRLRPPATEREIAALAAAARAAGPSVDGGAGLDGANRPDKTGDRGTDRA